MRSFAEMTCQQGLSGKLFAVHSNLLLPPRTPAEWA
jgi:hypothetical protein